MLQYLNQNAGAINVLLACVIAAATLVYVLLTRTLVLETRRTRELQSDPLIAVYAEDTVSIHFQDFVVRNIGAGPAYKIRFQVLQDFECEKSTAFSTLPFVSAGLKYLAPAQQFSFFLTNLLENSDVKLEAALKLRVGWENREGREFSEDFTIDFSHRKGCTYLQRKDVEDVARELEKIGREIGHLSSGFHKLQVIVHERKPVASES